MPVQLQEQDWSQSHRQAAVIKNQDDLGAGLWKVPRTVECPQKGTEVAGSDQHAGPMVRNPGSNKKSGQSLKARKQGQGQEMICVQ